MQPKSHVLNDATAQPESQLIDDRVRAGFDLLRRAYLYAQDANADVWDFALNIDKLYGAGLGISDLRWLIAKCFALHGKETSVYGDSHRSFRRSDGYNFEKTSCLILTPSGADLANRVGKNSATQQPLLTRANNSGANGHVADLQSEYLRAIDTNGSEAEPKPSWDPALRELSLGDVIVKRFRVPARNQEMILSVFEEEGWPEHIDDPLPFSNDVDPHTRLHDTIHRLNGHQTNRLLRTGVLWEDL